MSGAAARVRAVSTPVATVRVLELAPEAGAQPYSPGSHIDVEIIINGRRDTRSYSLVGLEPRDGAYRVAVKQLPESRGGSRFMWERKVGDLLYVSQPENRFELYQGAPAYLLLAGGIGITPLVGMAELLQRAGANYRLVYAGRTRGQMPFVAELGACCGEHLAVIPDDEGAPLDIADELRRLDQDAELYMCGPLGMMRAVRHAWEAAGRPGSRLRFETFASSGASNNEAFEVVVRAPARRVTVRADQSMLEALQAAGIELPGHCRRGECGLCAVAVVEASGSFDHRDVFLSDAARRAGGTICPCVSRATGCLVIDTGYRDEL